MFCPVYARTSSPAVPISHTSVCLEGEARIHLIVDQLPKARFVPGFVNSPGRFQQTLRSHRQVHVVIKMHDTTPFLTKGYPIAFSLRPEVEAVIEQRLALGAIKREASPFASPLTVVRNKDGSVRICFDAHWVNQRMVADCETPRPPEDLLQSFQSIRFMSAIDLRSSYGQIPLSSESTPYTAFLCNGQSYIYQCAAFRVENGCWLVQSGDERHLGP
jgi:hypothetical protein